MQSRRDTRNGFVRPKSSLSEHVAREIQRDYPSNTHRTRRREPLKSSAQGIKRFMFATAGGVKRVSVATGKGGAKVGGTLKRSATSLAKMAYNEWTYSEYSPKNNPYGHPVISPPIIVPEQPGSPQLSPFFTYSSEPRTPINTPPPNVNPASSIEELLRAYGVAPGPRPFQHRMPPPPARAIFPPGYTTLNRVHVRSRPGSSRPFSRAGPSSRPATQHIRVPSVLSSNPSRPSTRSDAASDVLGRPSLYLEVRRASPLRSRGENERPETAGSIVPRLRSRKPMAEVISCSTQTSPPPTATTFGKDAKSSGSAVPKQATGSENVEVAPSRTRRRKKRSRGTRRNTNRLTPTSITTEIVLEEDSLKARRQENWRDLGAQNVSRREAPANAEQMVHSSSHSASFNDRSQESGSSQVRRVRSMHANTGVSHPSWASTRTNMTEIETVSEAMEQYYRSQTNSSSRTPGTSRNSPPSPMSSTLYSPQLRSKSRVVVDPVVTTPRISYHSPPVVRIGPPTPVYEIPAVIESFDNSPSEYNPTGSRSSHRSARTYGRSDAAGQLRSLPSEVHEGHRSEQIGQRSNGVENGLSRRGHERSHETVNSSHLRTSSVNSHIQLPAGYTIYNRPLDPRLSHFSMETYHSRNPSQATETSTFTSPRLSHGPLSLTADRYRGASTPTPPNQAPIRYRRRPNGLSIDTTLSKESYRSGWEPQWQSPILRRNNAVVTNGRGPSA